MVKYFVAELFCKASPFITDHFCIWGNSALEKTYGKDAIIVS